jgi:threonine/homoserine/homoserine lactone efflux protein
MPIPMPLDTWLAFVAASAVLLVLPGPTILTVISYSIAHGRHANLPLVAAVALGDATALALSLIGLGALLQASAAWFTAIKWAACTCSTWACGCCGPVSATSRPSRRGRPARAGACSRTPTW